MAETPPPTECVATEGKLRCITSCPVKLIISDDEIMTGETIIMKLSPIQSARLTSYSSAPRPILSSSGSHLVELLRDNKGIYGIAATKVGRQIDDQLDRIVLRPDRLDDNYCGSYGSYCIYQMITGGGFRHGMFTNTMEERLRQVIHHQMLRRAGLPWPPPQAPAGHYVRYWSTDKAQRIRNREIYHGLRLGSLAVINRLIQTALQEAAVPEAIKQARRFRFRDRQYIYRAGATSSRALQLIEAFPVLALAIFSQHAPVSPGILYGQIEDYSRAYDQEQDRRREARILVERGTRLAQIADLMHVPMGLRKVKPGAADLGLQTTDLDQRLIHAHMPDSLRRMRVWLSAIWFASKVNPDFAEWTAKHTFEIADTERKVISFLQDTADWVRACYGASGRVHIDQGIPGGRSEHHGSQGEEFVTRRFSRDMSLRTVKQLSEEWHEAIANNMNGPLSEFPEPWYDGGIVRDYEMLPITNSADLYREGHAMHHCVGAYGDRVRQGLAYIYTVHGVPVATVELVRMEDRPSLGQIRGPCNSLVSQEITRAVQNWLRAQKEFRFPKTPGRQVQSIVDEIPF